MEDAHKFTELLSRVRNGDQSAATELVRLYEPTVRRAVRLKLTDPRLRRIFDSVDICQSVLGNFFDRARAGQFDLSSPEQLLRLLVEMAHNKLLDRVRHERTARRDARRVCLDGEVVLETFPDHQDTPSELLIGQEMLERVRARLTDEERNLMEQRDLGRSWEELALELGAKPDALRMKLRRALTRISQQVGLDAPRA